MAQYEWEQTKAPIEYTYTKLLFDNQLNLFAATESNGLLLSRDNGDTWEEVRLDSQPDSLFIVKDMLVKGINDLYVLSHDRIYLTSDVGKTWELLSETSLQPVNGIMLDNNRNLIAYGGRGASLSLDNGQTWERHGEFISTVTAGVDFGGTLFFAERTSGVMEADPIDSYWSITGVQNRLVNKLYSHGRYLYACWQSGESGGVLGYPDIQSWYNASSGISSSIPFDMNVDKYQNLLCGTTSGLWKFNSDRMFWTNAGLTMEVRSLAFNPFGYVFAGTKEGGIYREKGASNNVNRLPAAGHTFKININGKNILLPIPKQLEVGGLTLEMFNSVGGVIYRNSFQTLEESTEPSIDGIPVNSILYLKYMIGDTPFTKMIIP